MRMLNWESLVAICKRLTELKNINEINMTFVEANSISSEYFEDMI